MALGEVETTCGKRGRRERAEAVGFRSYGRGAVIMIMIVVADEVDLFPEQRVIGRLCIRQQDRGWYVRRRRKGLGPKG